MVLENYGIKENKMIKRVKREKTKLEKLIELLVKKGVIKKEELK